MSGGRGESPYNEADEPRRMSAAELCANGHNCNIAAQRSYKTGNSVAAAGYEIAGAIYHCTLHLVDALLSPMPGAFDDEED